MKSPITAIETGLLFFLAFEGFLCVCWLISLCSGYSIDVHILTNKGNRILLLLFSFYIIVRYFCANSISFKNFAGLSYPLIVMLAIMYINELRGYWYYSSSNFMIVLVSLSVPIVAAAAFSIPIKKENLCKVFWFYLIPIVVISLIMVITFSQQILDGYTFRAKTFTESTVSINLCTSVFAVDNADMMWKVTVLPGFWGGILGLISIWAVYMSKKNTVIAAGLAGYILGSVLMYSAAAVSFTIGYYLCGIIILFANVFYKRYLSYAVIPFILITNLLLLSYIGKSDLLGVSYRYSRYIQNFIKINERSPDKKIMNSYSVGNTNNNDWVIVDFLIPDKTYIRGVNKIRSANRDDYIELMKYYHLKDTRQTLYKIALDYMYKHPITGYGTSSFIVKHNKEYIRFAIHNNVLAAFISTGIIGGACYLFVIMLGFYDSWIIMCRYKEIMWLPIVFLFSIIGWQIHTVLINFWILLPMVVMRATVVSLRQEQTRLTGNESDVKVNLSEHC